MNEMDDVIREFLVESFENLDQLDRDFVTLEKNPRDQERLASVFRTIHTIKGTCGFFEFARLGALTHAGENLLSQLREDKLLLTPEITSTLLALVDAVRRSLAHIEQTGGEDATDHAPLIAALTCLSSGSSPEAQQVSEETLPETPAVEPLESFGGLAEGNRSPAIWPKNVAGLQRWPW